MVKKRPRCGRTSVDCQCHVAGTIRSADETGFSRCNDSTPATGLTGVVKLAWCRSIIAVVE